jgi:hypothetical protein
MHWDQSFFNYWQARGYNATSMNAMLRSYFDGARADYQNNSGLHNIDLILLDDFNRATGPMSTYYDNASLDGGNTRLIAAMRTRLKTGTVNKTVPNGSTHLLGRTINIVFVAGNFGRLAGEVDSIPALGTADANAFVTTTYGGFFDRDGNYVPLQNQRTDLVAETLIHEIGHLFGGVHPTGSEATRECVPRTLTYELMCPGRTPLQRRFGAANYRSVENVIKGHLQRCNSAYTSTYSCEQAVIADCSRILDYTQIQPCIDFAVPIQCAAICTTPLKQARVVINSVGAVVTSGVSAPGPGQNQ